MGKETKSMEEGNVDSEDLGEDYVPFDIEDNQDMHLGNEEEEMQQMKKGKKRVKMEKMCLQI